MIKKYLETGKIVGTHGVRGMVRIQPWADSGEFLTRFKKLYLDENGENSVTVLKAQPHGGVVIASFKNTETIEQAVIANNRSHPSSIPELTANGSNEEMNKTLNTGIRTCFE